MLWVVPSTALSWSFRPFRVDMALSKVRLPCPVQFFQNKSDTRSLQVFGARRAKSQDIVKKTYRKPGLCVCKKAHFLHWSLISNSQENRIESATRPDLIQFLSKSNALKTFKVTNIGRRERPRWTDCRIRQILPQGSLPELEEFHVSCLPNEGLSTVENHRYYYTWIHLIIRRGRQRLKIFYGTTYIS